MSQSYEEYLEENGMDKINLRKFNGATMIEDFIVQLVILEQLLILQSVNTVVRYCFHI